MLSKSNIQQLKKLETNIRTLLKKTSRTKPEDRLLGDHYRAVLRMYQDTLDEHLPKKHRPTETQKKKLAIISKEHLYLIAG